VHDHVLDGFSCQVGQHALELGPVSRAGRLTAFDEGLNDAGTERLGAPFAGQPLSRDRVAVGVAVALQLLLRADADVQHGARWLERWDGLQLTRHARTPAGIGRLARW
jgi:hypothetical protein